MYYRIICNLCWIYLSMAELMGIFEGHVPEIMVPENISIGSTVLRDIRAHLNLPPKSLVKLGPGSLTHFFRLDAESGQLISVRSVDLESPEMCETEKSCCRVEVNGLSTSTIVEPQLAPRGSLTSGILNDHSSLQNERRTPDENKACRLMAFVLASATVESQLAPISKLYITITDLNDNPPVFKVENTNLKYELTETTSSPPRIHVAFLEGSGGLNNRQDLVPAYDADFSVLNRVKRYWLEWGATDKENLTPTASGSITSIRSSNPLNVDDQNGLTWSILGPFRLVYLEAGRTLALELDTELDRERQKNYNMRLIAEDSGNLRGELNILVDVIDTNEFAPIFVDEFRTGGLQMPLHRQSTIYQKHYTLKESLPVGTEIGRLRATDEDDSPDQVITYRLGPGNPQNEVSKTFQLNPTTGSLVLVGLLDYERTKRYRLTVIAQDGPSMTYGSNLLAINDQFQQTGTTRRSTTGIVEITITDVNDNAPVIRFEKDNKIGTDVEPGTIHTRTSAHYEVWIKEDIVKGSPVTYFSTLDPDSAENGRVSCNLLNWTDRFRLREFAGLYGIETLTEFDRETTDVYYLTIKCQDQGVPPLQNSQILIIHVEDVNDLPPSFPLPIYQFHVLEDSVSGTPLLPVNANYPVAVTATDPDLNSTIVYRLEPLEPNRAINTEARLGSVGSSSAMDHLLFRIDPRLATLTAQGELDRETRALLAFHVCADDGKHSTCTDVTVILDDVNDNRPIFDRDTYVLRVEENQLSNKPLVIFRVTDADSNNQGFTFEFVNDGKPLSKITSSAMQKTNNSEIQQYKTQFEPGSVRYHFALRENTLYLRRPLDRELRSSYHFFIRAVDVHDFSPIREFVKAGWTVNHPQNLTSQAEIFVDVGDVNDNAPILIFPNSTGPLGNRLTVSCHETMGSSVGRLQATDTDLGQNASVLFTLIHTPEVDQLFYLDTNSGELFVNTGQLEEKCGQSAIMVVSADDQGSIESKKSRAAPVERLLIKLEDKPTLAEIIAAEARHKLRHLGEGAVGSAVQNRDASTIYSSLSARAILSVVLGGSTVFLIGLLIVWMILLVYNRSKRQKRLNQLQLVQTKRQSHNTAVNPQLQAAVNSPERMLYGTISSEERCASLPSQTDRTWSVRNSEKPCGSTAFPIGVDLQYGFVVKEDMDYPQTKEGNYGQYSVRLANSPTLTSSVSPTASIPFESQRADRPPRIWHCDTQACHNLHLDTCSVDDLARTRSKTWTRTDMPKKSLQTFTLGRLLPKWFTNNLPPRPKTGRNTPLWSTPEPIGGQLLEANQLFYSKKHSAKNDDHSPKHYLLLPTTLRGLDRPSSGNSIHPSSNQVIYATCRRENLKPVTFAPATMNNQNDSNICQFTPPSYLTPPTTRHLKQEQKVNTIDTQVSPINKHNDYTTLIKDSYRPDTNDFKSASATPYLTQQSGPTPIHQTRSNAPSTEQYSRTAQESVLPQICPGELVYPCCCASCEPSCDSTWMVYDGVSAGQSGSDSTRTCPQCHSLETQRSSRTYHASDCPKSVQTNADIEEPMPGTSNPRARTPQTQGSTNYLSVQQLFNSCV